MRRLALSPIAIAAAILFVVEATCGGGCSSSSRLIGGGTCEAFCTKWVGAKCKSGPTTDACMNECVDREKHCKPANDAVVHCATLEGTIACETGSGQPKILGCRAREGELAQCMKCDHFCAAWTGTDGAAAVPACPVSPARAACLAACTGPVCAGETVVYVVCAGEYPHIACAADGTPYATDPTGERDGCPEPLSRLRACLVRSGGTGTPFDWPPPSRDRASDPNTMIGGDGGDR